MSETSAKLAHLLPHWIEHNEAHVESYRQWIDRAREEGMTEVAEALEKTVRAVSRANDTLKQAVSFIPGVKDA